MKILDIYLDQMPVLKSMIVTIMGILLIAIGYSFSKVIYRWFE